MVVCVRLANASTYLKYSFSGSKTQCQQYLRLQDKIQERDVQRAHEIEVIQESSASIAHIHCRGDSNNFFIVHDNAIERRL